METTKVRDVMTVPVVAIRTHARYDEIADTLRRCGVSAVPVIDPAALVVGVVSEADLLPKVAFPDGGLNGASDSRRRRLARAKASRDTAAELMTQPPVTVGPDASISQAARLMEDHRVKRLPVVDGEGRLVGIVSRCDLLRGSHAFGPHDTPPAVEAVGPAPADGAPGRHTGTDDDWGW
jgi:CBS domain-containing protein